ncbi:SLC13 family permease [Crenobacter caeni]|nr:DASS family sodium-coupled anion symporter [Crenobacter caeni]
MGSTTLPGVAGMGGRQPEARKPDMRADAGFDPLDMSQYSLSKLPKRAPTQVGVFFQQWGLLLAGVVFVLTAYLLPMPGLDAKQQVMFGLFTTALFLWISEAVPNYLTSMLLICGLILTKTLKAKAAMATLGDPTIWLNVSAFIMASAMVSTDLAKRAALAFVLKFGKNAGALFLSFMAINIILSAFINATAAKAALMMPLFMVVSAVYGAPGTNTTNNFARNLVLHNLLMINAGSNAFMTGSGANLMGVALLAGAGVTVYYIDWLAAGLPITIALGILTYVIGVRFIFPLTKEDKEPKLEGGREALQRELDKLGKFKLGEVKAALIFFAVLAIWATDKLHGLNATVVAMLGATVMLMPQTKLIDWNKVDIPWHLMLFSAGAYSLGAGLNETKLMTVLTTQLMDSLGMNSMGYFELYAVLTGLFIASHWIFQSKNMRTLIFLPIVIGVAETLQLDVMSLALPVALCINMCWTLPFNAKPNAMLYGCNKYTMGEAWKYGATMSVVAWLLMLVAGGTWLHWLGITPGFF